MPSVACLKLRCERCDSAGKVLSFLHCQRALAKSLGRLIILLQRVFAGPRHLPLLYPCSRTQPALCGGVGLASNFSFAQPWLHLIMQCPHAILNRCCRVVVAAHLLEIRCRDSQISPPPFFGQPSARHVLSIGARTLKGMTSGLMTATPWYSLGTYPLLDFHRIDGL